MTFYTLNANITTDRVNTNITSAMIHLGVATRHRNIDQARDPIQCQVATGKLANEVTADICRCYITAPRLNLGTSFDVAERDVATSGLHLERAGMVQTDVPAAGGDSGSACDLIDMDIATSCACSERANLS